MRTFRIASCIALLVAATMALSQTSPGDLIADVPFAFVAGGKSLPEGRYIVKPISESCLRIFSSSNSVLVSTHAAERSNGEESKLVFHRYGDTYFLSAAWVTGNTTGRQLFQSRAERDLANRDQEMELAMVRATK